MRNYVISLMFCKENGDTLYFTKVCQCINIIDAMRETRKEANKLTNLPEDTAWALSQPIYSEPAV